MIKFILMSCLGLSSASLVWGLSLLLVGGFGAILKLGGLNKNLILSLEEKESFECGFNSFTLGGGFCIQFLKIALLFLLVDLEIALIIPFFVFSLGASEAFFSSPSLLIFVGLFLVGLLWGEKKLGGLNWSEELSEFQL